jgi:hypothetical protein
MTIWNTLDSNPQVNVSGGGLTITQTGTGQGYIRSTVSKSSGKFYFEHKLVHIEQYLGYGVGVVGIITDSSALSNYSANGCTIDAQGTVWSCGIRYSNVLPLGGTLAVNDTFSIAFDLVNKRFWCRHNGGNWNGNATNDPATNVGGIDISALFPTNAAFAYAALTGTNNPNTLLSFVTNFGASNFAFAVPNNFARWDPFVMTAIHPFP